MAGVDETFCKKIPKIELHAHLSGSISQRTLKKLYQAHKQVDTLDFTEADLLLAGQQNYEQAFKIFRMLHSLVTHTDHVELIAEDVINEFYQDNVFYLELRSTPKALGSCTKDHYMMAIVNSIKKCMNMHSDLFVSFLVSIDRSRSLEDAKENVELAKKYNKLYPDIIVGVELSGNPAKGDINELIPTLKQARQYGLKIIAHIGEVKNEVENMSLLQLNSDRVGHAVYIHPAHGGSAFLFEELQKHRTPIEVCLSSNISGGIVENYSNHPIKEFYRAKHPIVLCTDDKGLFGTTLSHEYLKASQILNLDQREMWKLSEDAIDCISASSNVKEKLRKLWKSHQESVIQ